MMENRNLLILLMSSILNVSLISGAQSICTIELNDGRTIKSEFCEETETTLYYYNLS